MTAVSSMTTKRKFNITVMRPILQIATLEIEAATRDEAIELAQQRESTLKNDDWQGPWERAIYDEAETDNFHVFSNASPRQSAEPL